MRRLLASLAVLAFAAAAQWAATVDVRAWTAPTAEATPNAVASAGGSTVSLSATSIHDGDTVVVFALQIGAGARTYSIANTAGSTSWSDGPEQASAGGIGGCDSFYSTNAVTSSGTVTVDLTQSSTSVNFYGMIVGIHGSGSTLVDSDAVDDNASPYDFDATFTTGSNGIFAIFGAAANGSMVTFTEAANPATWTMLNIFAGATTAHAAYVSNSGSLTNDPIEWSSGTTRRVWECGLAFDGAASGNTRRRALLLKTGN